MFQEKGNYGKFENRVLKGSEKVPLHGACTEGNPERRARESVRRINFVLPFCHALLAAAAAAAAAAARVHAGVYV